MSRSRTPPGRSPGSTSSLRAANQQRVLTLLRRGEAYAQAELARMTGLAPATVSNIVRDLVGAGLVETESGSGRRGSSVRLATGAGLVAGVDFGHSHVAVALGDLTGAVLAEDRRPLASTHAYDESLALAASMLDGLAHDLGDAAGGAARRGPLRVGMGLPAPLSENVIRSVGILPGWQGVDTQKAAEDVFGLPVEVENDANLGALAEHRSGIAQGRGSSVFVKLSSGVGVGIILEDRLFHGANGTAGELGHLTLDESGPLCRCGGRGCLETYTAAPTVLAMTAELLPEAETHPQETPGIQDVVVAGAAGHVAARRALEDAGLHLGWGLAAVVNLLNPEVIVVGGDMARAGDLLLDSVRIGLRRHALDAVGHTPVVASELGERASLVGAVLLAAERVELGVD